MAYKLNQDINPSGIASAYVDAPFDKGKEALESQGYRIISLEENARLRMQQGKDAFVSRNGNWTMEGVLYIPNKGAYLTKKSPIMANAQEATNCHRNGKDFYLTDSQVQESLSDSVKLSGSSIPTNRFKDNEITAYAFGNIAEQYGQFLREAGIKEMPVWLANLQDKSFARQMWFAWLRYDYRSVLDGDGRGLLDDYRVRGVSCGVADSAAGGKKISVDERKVGAYIPEQISSALEAQGITGDLEKRVLKSLL